VETAAGLGVDPAAGFWVERAGGGVLRGARRRRDLRGVDAQPLLLPAASRLARDPYYLKITSVHPIGEFPLYVLELPKCRQRMCVKPDKPRGPLLDPAHISYHLI
jgi:hypothetical protein